MLRSAGRGGQGDAPVRHTFSCSVAGKKRRLQLYRQQHSGEVAREVLK